MNVDWDSLPPEAQEALLNSPLMEPPPGFESQVGKPPGLNPLTIGLTTASLFVMTVVFLMRAYSRIFCTKRIRTEDVFGLIAFIAAAVHAYTVIQMDIDPGTFLHTWQYKVKDLEPYWKDFLVLRTFYCIMLCFCKNAILLEWIHIFVPLPQRTVFFWLCVLLIFANTGLYIAAIVSNFVAVLPIESLWKPWMASRILVDREKADTAVVSFNLVCDVMILVLPQKVIWKLNLNRKRKVGLSFLFGLGLLTCIFAGGRVYSTVTLNWHYDTLHDVPGVILWGVGEATFAMMVFCVPAIPRIFSGKESGLLSRINKSLRSWTLIVTGSSRTQSQTGSTSQQSWPKTSATKSYHKMAGDSEIALTDVDIERLGGNPNERITKTTELVTSEDAPSERGIRAAHQHTKSQQHPWMAERR